MKKQYVAVKWGCKICYDSWDNRRIPLITQAFYERGYFVGNFGINTVWRELHTLGVF